MHTESAESATAPKAGATKTEKGATSKKPGGTKPKKSTTPPTNDNAEGGPDTAKRWAIKGADNEAIITFQKAAQKRGKKINQFFNEDIRQYCIDVISKKSEVPAAPADVAGMVAAEMQTAGKQMEDRIVERLAAMMQQSNNSNTETTKTLWQRIFGG